MLLSQIDRGNGVEVVVREGADARVVAGAASTHALAMEADG